MRRNMKHARFTATWLAAMALALTAACQDVSVTTVPVGTVTVSPADLALQVDSTGRLTATLHGEGGVPLSNRSVTWTSSDVAIATVNGDGLVSGVAPGTVAIRASAEGVTGEARVTVVRGPAITASPLLVEFTASQGAPDPGDRVVAITNAGTGSLTGLSATVRYETGQPTGWLTANLASSSAPTSMVLRARAGGMAAGSYHARVELASSRAANSPVVVEVVLTVIAASAAIGLDAASVTFSAVAGGPDPSPRTVAVSNAGGGSLSGLTATIEYTTSPGGWLSASLGSTVAPTTLTLRASTGTLPSGTHTARVLVSASGAGNSPQQVAVTFTVTAGAPSTPGSLAAAAVSGSRIDLSWTASAGGVQWYRIQRRLAAGGSYAVIDSVAGGTTRYEDRNLLPLTGYQYRVQACGAGGCSAWSNEASATTLAAAPPDVPGDVVATRISSTQVELSWKAPGGQTRYEIRRRTGTGGAWTFELTVPGDATSWLDSGLTPHTTYQYQLRACSPAGCSEFSPIATVSTSPGSGDEG
jgi:hypothetical protein